LYRSEASIEEELLSDRLEEALDLAGGGRGDGSREDVADAVRLADPVEHHDRRLVGELPGEDPPVVCEDLGRNAVAREGLEERFADGFGGGPSDEARHHAEPRVVVYPGHDLELGTVFEHHP